MEIYNYQNLNRSEYNSFTTSLTNFHSPHTHTPHDNNDKNDSFSETLFAVSVSLLVFIFLVIPVIVVINSALYLTK